VITPITGAVTVVTVISISLLVAVGVVKQVALLVITTVTLSPFARVVVVKLAPVAPPTGLPFTNHW
jgi:hypothetical protein